MNDEYDDIVVFWTIGAHTSSISGPLCRFSVILYGMN